jgi:hypothetical protein
MSLNMPAGRVCGHQVVIIEFCEFCGKIDFNENMKLLEEMPKITKGLKLRYSVDFKLETQDRQLFNFHDFWFPYAQHRSLIKKTERSDTTILGILEHFRHFRHFPVYPG